MNIFKELNKLPQTDINEVSYGTERLVSDTKIQKCRNRALERWSNPEWVANRSTLGRCMPKEEKKKKSIARQKWWENPVNREKMKQIRSNNAQSRLAKQHRKQIEKYYTLWRAEVEQNIQTGKRQFSAQKIAILLGIKKHIVNDWLTRIHKENII